jgi:hypothetical protein
VPCLAPGRSVAFSLFRLDDANLTFSPRFVSDGIAASITISLINYVLLGFQFKVDGFFMHSFEIFLATTVVFWGSGTVGYTLLEYRLAQKKLVSSHGRDPEALLHGSLRGSLGPLSLDTDHHSSSFAVDSCPSRKPPVDSILVSLFPLYLNYFLIPLCLGSFFFFGGLSIPVTQAIFAHLFSYNIQWSATVKEVERSNFFLEIPKIARRSAPFCFIPTLIFIFDNNKKRFWFPMLLSVVILVGMILCATSVIPFEWRVMGSAWAVILPLS